MKELSIEEKAARYDDAIKRIEDIETGKCETTFMFTEGLFEHIFPELQESEDERMRNTAINACKYMVDNFENSTKQYEDAIAWLEKQGEQKFIDKIRLGKKYKCIASPRYSTFKKGEIYKPEDKFLCSLMNFCSDCFEPIEDSGHNPTDKAEPKFKNGQWIVWQDKCYKVNYNGCGYELVDQNGLSTLLEYGTIDENAHVWDITKDAKDGDVLATDDGRPFIFEGLLNKNHSEYPVAYCGIDVMDNFISASSYNMWTNKEVCPATKEQRDTLMKAMADAGYTFDFEKKELKKIEQKSAWSEEDEAMLDTLIADYEFLSKKYRDEEHDFFAGMSLVKDDLNMISWLKSLKERYTWNPSDEQMDNK